MTKKKDKREQYDELVAMRDYDRNALLDHIKSLGLPDVKSYKDWCRDNNFSIKLDSKGYGQFKKERQYVISLSAEGTLRHHKQLTKSLPATIEDILLFKVEKNQIDKSSLFNRLFEIRDKLKDKSDREALVKILKIAEKKSKFFEDLTKGRVIEKLGAESTNSYFEAIVHLIEKKHQWLNSPEDWKPKTHNAHKQFLSLVDHLLCKYPVPEFMYSAWFTTLNTHREWFIHLTQGGNIRKAPGLNVELTKKQAHTFNFAPKWYGVTDALKWAQVVGAGGDHRLAETISRTRMGQGNYISDFWMTVVLWLINNPMLDPIHIGPICDYIHNQKFEPRTNWVAGGVLERLGPAQPDFNMKGRTAEALLRQVNEWHGQLRKSNNSGYYAWEKSTIPGLDIIEGTAEKQNMRRWIIEELCDTKALAEEGRAMKHCVSSYSNSCRTGRCTIWSLKLDDLNGLDRKLTIEVTTANKTIVQVRGKMNRLPEPVETRIVEKWAAEAGLTVDYHRRRW